MIEKFFALALQFATWVIDSLGYPGIVLLMAIESACIPLPSEIIMPLAGYLVTLGRFDLYWAATAGAIGCNVGSVLAYEIGYYGGRPLVEKYGSYILMSRHDVDMADRFFKRYGAAAIFIGRLLPIVRTFIALPAGIARMPRIPFHIYTFLGSWPWCFGLAWLGMKLGDHWMDLKPYFMRFKIPIVLLLLAGVVWFVWTHWKNRVRIKEELPTA
ncbi:MAG TPA: DedA family protein [Terriglobales bacterium]|nr:DedA family protein [Terriglobales bacterium]